MALGHLTGLISGPEERQLGIEHHTHVQPVWGRRLMMAGRENGNKPLGERDTMMSAAADPEGAISGVILYVSSVYKTHPFIGDSILKAAPKLSQADTPSTSRISSFFYSVHYKQLRFGHDKHSSQLTPV